jgi:cell division protein FtsZ
LTIGAEWTRGLGCGGDPEVAAKIVDAAGADLQRAFKGGDLLLVLGCLGRGTASGVVPALARLAREADILPMFLLTLPFATEGNNRMAVARRALDVTRQSTDIVIPLANDLVFGTLPENTSLGEAMNIAAGMIGDAAIGLAEMVRCQGAIPLDFASLRNSLKGQAAICTVGIASADEVTDADAFIDSAVNSPLFGGADNLKTADVVAATLVGKSFSLKTMQAVLGGIQSRMREETRSLVGVNDADAASGTQLTILSIRYDTRSTGKLPHTAPSREPLAGESRPRKRRSKKADDTRQIELPFLETPTSLGIFGNAHPTLYHSENLDIPTYQRRGVAIRAEVDDQ